jgi:NADPH:quinone reductase-like Zn-dependent oxidoreductase
MVQTAATEAAAEHGIRVKPMLVHSDADQLTRIAALIDAGDLKPVISTVLPLAEAARAHELSQTGHVRGKIVLKVSA